MSSPPLGHRDLGRRLHHRRAGRGVIGIHGTSQPALIGQAVSHGCIRMRNKDILALRRWAKPGTRLVIQR
jgi:L,D-transpeptidase ErfK/SrfK